MAEVALLARSPLDAALRPGQHGRSGGAAGVTLQAVAPGGVASVAARLARRDAAHAGLGLPPPRRWAELETMRAVWSGPNRWLLLAARDIEAELRERLGDTASVTDQTDARCFVRVAGPRARDALAKGVPLDLHPRAFRPGDAATTLAAHVAVQLWQLDDTPRYDVAVARSYAADLAAFLVHAASEFGVETLSPGAA